MKILITGGCGFVGTNVAFVFVVVELLSFFLLKGAIKAASGVTPISATERLKN